MFATAGCLVLLVMLLLAVWPRVRLTRDFVPRGNNTSSVLDPSTSADGQYGPDGLYAAHDTSPVGGWSPSSDVGHHGSSGDSIGGHYGPGFDHGSIHHGGGGGHGHGG